MVDYSPDELGRAVRRLREQKGLTQEQLGRGAGYGAGAGVAVSRIEGGLLRPGPEKFAGIARVLGLQPEELMASAASEAEADGPSGSSSGSGAGDDDAGAASGRTAGSSRELKERARRIQAEIDERTAVITNLTEAFNAQHDRARDDFFMKFVAIANSIDGAPQPDPSSLEDEESTDPSAVAAFRLKSNASGIGHLLAGGAGGAVAGAAVGGAAAYGTFVAAATFGAASTGAAISGLSGVAATNAALALLGGGTLAAGGAGVAGGTALLASIVAAPTAILFAGGLLWMAKRNRRQQQELAAQLDAAEAQLAATAPGYAALQQILPQATELLDYIATHAGHALGRWMKQLAPGVSTWDSLAEAGQQQYQEFVEIAAAQLTIVTINVQGVLTTQGDEQEQLIDVAHRVLAQSEDTVRALV